MPWACLACSAPFCMTSDSSLPSMTALHPGIRSPHRSCFIGASFDRFDQGHCSHRCHAGWYSRWRDTGAGRARPAAAGAGGGRGDCLARPIGYNRRVKIVSIGGGPAGLYFAILMKKADRAHDVVVLERNRPDDTFGFGVVFSDATLERF